MNSQGNNENLSELPVNKNGMVGNDTTSMGNEGNISPLFNTSGRPSVHFESPSINHRGVDNSPAWMTRQRNDDTTGDSHYVSDSP